MTYVIYRYNKSDINENCLNILVKLNLTLLSLTEVYVSFYLLAINELNEVTETLKTTGYLYVEWVDQHLVWNSTDYGGIEEAFWPQVW